MARIRTTTLNYRPDDMHVHFREDERMGSVVSFTARQFHRAIVMPNTKPLILTVDDAGAYRDAILAVVPSGVNFEPLMTLYLQEVTSLDTIRAAKKSGFIHGIKMYPKGKTTNAHGGVIDVRDVKEQLEVMQEVDIPLLMHGESAAKDVDIFNRESAFYDDAFDWLIHTFPKLRISCEHVTTAHAARKILAAPRDRRIGATVTPQHLLVNRNYMLDGALRPHAFCKPILKKEEDRRFLLDVVTGGSPRFFLGTDSAPHPQHGNVGMAKECDCGCAGCFTAHAALEMYAEAFESRGRLAMLENFASKFGAEFYELPRNQDSLTLEEISWQAEPSYKFGDDVVVPFRQEVPLQWRMM